MWNTSTPEAAPDFPAIRIGVASGIILSGGNEVALSPRERQIAIAIAAQAWPVGTARLVEFFGCDERATSVGSIKVYVHRLRRKVHEQFILRLPDGYAVHPDVGIDLRDARRLLTEIASGPLAPARREEAIAVMRDLGSDPPGDLMELPWYRAIAQLAARTSRELAVAVARGDREAVRPCSAVREINARITSPARVSVARKQAYDSYS